MNTTDYIKDSLITNFLLLIYYFRQIFLYVNRLYIQFCMYFYKEKDIVFVKQNKIIKTLDFNNIENIPKSEYFVINYDVENKKLVKVSDDYSILDYPENIPSCCSFRFILVALKSNDKSIDIGKYLYNDDKTYYLENSILFDKNFVNWMCINYLKEDLQEVKINIIDHNANSIELDSSQYIKLGLNNYHIDQLS